MSDASVRTIGHDDEASLWTTTSHSTIGIDHLKRRARVCDIDKRLRRVRPLMTASPHNPFMTNGRQRPPTSEKSTATVYPSGPLAALSCPTDADLLEATRRGRAWVDAEGGDRGAVD